MIFYLFGSECMLKNTLVSHTETEITAYLLILLECRDEKCEMKTNKGRGWNKSKIPLGFRGHIYKKLWCLKKKKKISFSHPPHLCSPSSVDFFFKCYYIYSLHLGLQRFHLIRQSGFTSERERDGIKVTKTSRAMHATMREEVEINPAFQLIPLKDVGKKEWLVAAGVLTWKSNQLIEGRKAQHLILLSGCPCSRQRVCELWSIEGERETLFITISRLNSNMFSTLQNQINKFFFDCLWLDLFMYYYTLVFI